MYNTLLYDAYGRRRIISGVDNTNLYSVNREIQKATNLGNELTTTQQFWQQLYTSRMENNQLGDLNMDGQVNNNDFLILQNAIQGNIQLNEIQSIAADMNEDGVLDDTDLSIINPDYASDASDTSNNENTNSTNSTNTNPNLSYIEMDDINFRLLDDLKMDADIVTQKFTTEQKIVYLENLLDSLKKAPASEENTRQIATTQEELNREKLRSAMLDIIMSRST